MKILRILLVLFFTKISFAAEPRTPEEWNEHFKQKIKEEMTPEQKEELVKHQQEIQNYQLRAKQKKSGSLLREPTSEADKQAIHKELEAKGFKVDFSKEDEEDAITEAQETERQKQISRQQEAQKQARLAAEKAKSQAEGFDFAEDDNEPKVVKPADPKDISTWTEENVGKIDPKDFANLKTEDLKKLLKNPKLLEKLSEKQVQAIPENMLVDAINTGLIARIKGGNKLSDSFVSKLSFKQAEALIGEHDKLWSSIKADFSDEQIEFLRRITKPIDLTKPLSDLIPTPKESDIQAKKFDDVITYRIIKEAAKKVNEDFIKNPGSIDPDYIKYVDVKTLSKLSFVKIKELTATQIKSLLDIQIKALSSAQINSLTPDQLKAFEPKQMDAFTIQQITNFTSDRTEYFSPETQEALVTRLTGKKPEKSQKDESQTQNSTESKKVDQKLTPEQVEQFKKEAAKLDFSTMSLSDISSINPELFKHLTLDQVLKLTPEQVANMSSEQIKNFGPSGVLSVTNIRSQDKIISNQPGKINILKTIEEKVFKAVEADVLTQQKQIINQMRGRQPFETKMRIDQVVRMTDKDINSMSFTQLKDSKNLITDLKNEVKELKNKKFNVLADSLTNKIKLIEARVTTLNEKIQQGNALDQSTIFNMDEGTLKSYSDVIDGLRPNQKQRIEVALKIIEVAKDANKLNENDFNKMTKQQLQPYTSASVLAKIAEPQKTMITNAWNKLTGSKAALSQK